MKKSKVTTTAAYGTGKEIDTASYDDYEYEKWSGRLSVWDFQKTLANDDVLIGVFMLNFRGLKIPNCRAFYARESGVDFRLPCARFKMFERDRAEINEKLSAVVADLLKGKEETCPFD